MNNVHISLKQCVDSILHLPSFSELSPTSFSLISQSFFAFLSLLAALDGVFSLQSL